jgi:hypothetical protein
MKSTKPFPADYEAFEQNLARELGLSCSLAELRRVTANMQRITPRASTTAPAQPRTEQELVSMMAGKPFPERRKLLRAHRALANRAASGVSPRRR